jgi:dihydrofolate reductase
LGSTRYYLAQSLDGYLADDDGGVEWLEGHEGESDAEGAVPMGDDYDRFFGRVGALAMGSATYEFILGVGSWPYGDVPAWVFTSRELPVLEGADIRFARGAVEGPHAEAVAAAGDRDVWLVGGGVLASQFADAGLLDELLLTVVPVVLGSGLPTFAGRLTRSLVLTEARPFANGMVRLAYSVGR